MTVSNKTPRRNALNLTIGSELRTVPRRMTRERMRWYVDLLPTVEADDGFIHRGAGTIHDDDEYARKQGLPGIIADGMISTNWIAGLLFDAFGTDFLRRGRLRTRYVQPIYEDQVVICVARVTLNNAQPDGTTEYRFDVWCEDDTGAKMTVGEATVRSTAG
jgi:3-hydroxybutyryl-CoA dehydratase